MAQVIELALHARARRIFQLFLRRHGLDFFLARFEDEHFERIDPKKLDLVMTLASEAPGAFDPELAGPQAASARNMIRRMLIKKLAFQMVEAGQ